LIKIFTEISHYDSSKRNFLSDILRPFLPIERLKEFGIENGIIKLVKNIEDSDLCLLPLSWNYYLKTNTTFLAKKMIKKAQENGRKILIGVNGDYFIRIPNSEHIIGTYTSIYKSLNKSNYIPLPVIIRDPLQYINKDKIDIRKLNKIPSIGFCGQIDSNSMVSLLKLFKRVWQNILFYSQLSYSYTGPIIPPTFIRRKVLNIIEEKSDKIYSVFIRRSKYQGGMSKGDDSFESIRKEFYQNINYTDYTLCIRGTGNFSTRFYETLALGKIPIFINTDCILPFSDIINWKEHLVWIEYDEISQVGTKILEFHKSLTEKSFNQLQISNRRLWEEYFSFSGYFKQLISHIGKELN